MNAEFSTVSEENVSNIKNLRKLKQNALVHLLKRLKAVGLIRGNILCCLDATQTSLLPTLNLH